MTDDAMLRAAQAGDTRALNALLAEHVDRVHAVCRRILGNGPDAFDATQEALIAITRGLPRFDGRAAFSTWCHRVAANAALDELRRRKRRPVPSVLADDPPVAAGVAAVDARLDVEAALAHIEPEYRIALVLRDLCDLDYQAIADTLGIPIGTVRSRIARGRAALAAVLREPTDPSETSK